MITFFVAFQQFWLSNRALCQSLKEVSNLNTAIHCLGLEGESHQSMEKLKITCHYDYNNNSVRFSSYTTWFWLAVLLVHRLDNMQCQLLGETHVT
jgi:hypothetical protein